MSLINFNQNDNYKLRDQNKVSRQLASNEK